MLGAAKSLAALLGRRADSGVAAVEFALIAPMFLAIVMGIVVYGVYFFTWITVTHAASEGARASLAGLSTQERVQLATAQVNAMFASYAPLVKSENAVVVAQPSPTNPLLFQVSITYDFSQFGFGALTNLLPIPTQKPTITMTVSNGGY